MLTKSYTNYLYLILAILFITCKGISQTYEFSSFIFDMQELSKAKQFYSDDKKAFSSEINKLKKDAEKALKFKPVSVTEKELTPPSGDKHDYMSLAPYWWPDPKKKDGLPYIRRDGEVNPEREKYTDRNNLQKMSVAVSVLSLAYYFTDETRYAEHAVKLLSTWFINPATKMNANMNFAQFVPGRSTGRGAGIIEARSILFAFNASRLLDGYEPWDGAIKTEFQKWASDFLTWLQESKNGMAEADAENNHGTWYDVQVTFYSNYLGKYENAREILHSSRKKRISSQIEPDGSQPLELARTKSLHYSAFNLLAYFNLALLGDQLGVDLWNFQLEDGRSIRKAFDYLLPYFTGEAQWKYQQIEKFDIEKSYPLIYLACFKYNDQKYKNALEKIKTTSKNNYIVNLLFQKH